MEPDVTVDSLSDTIATLYRDPPDRGSVCLILGAGNVASIPPLDVIYKLFNDVVIIWGGKLASETESEVDDVLLPVIEIGGKVVIIVGSFVFVLQFFERNSFCFWHYEDDKK